MRSVTPRLQIRPGMDVYSAYQDQYIGTVTRVFRMESDEGSPGERGATPQQTGSTPEVRHGLPHLPHEGGAELYPAQHMPEKRLGEEMGPVPTIEAGNTGPVRQSSEQAYATEPVHGPLINVAYFAVRPGRINLGILTRPLYVPTSAVESISMERIVLNVQRENLPPEWRTRPA